MRKTFLSIALSLFAMSAFAADSSIPAGYKLVYEQNFDKPAAIDDFTFSDKAAWKLTKDGNGSALELVTQSKYEPKVRSPFNLALIKDKVVGDFVLEAELLQTGEEYGHRDMVLFFGCVAPAKFYYVHLATAADDHAHNIFIVNDQPRIKIAKETTKGINWGSNVWHKVRLERTAKEGTVKVFFDDLTHPIMIAQDKTFPEGLVGFGSFDDTGKVRHIKLWAPTVTTRQTDFFGK